ncbi:MAG: ADP-ribosylglycohydrolase family protein [Cyanobacteria bacterium J06650_10]
MLGAIAGDIIGSVHERTKQKSKAFPLFVKESTFTDDTVLSVAVADAIINNKFSSENLSEKDNEESYLEKSYLKKSYVHCLKRYGQDYFSVGYGASFKQWIASDEMSPYNSWGNGSAMRVSPVGCAFDEMSVVLQVAEQSAVVTHNHPEGIKGAQATAAAVLMARQGRSKVEIKTYIEQTFDYDLSRSIADIRPDYTFHVACQKSVPESIIAFLESTDFEDALRNAISLGGDADTMAAIAGGIAEAFYGGVPEAIAQQTLKRLDHPLRETTLQFCQRYVPKYGYSDLSIA